MDPPTDSQGKSRSASRGSLLVIFLTVFIDLLGFGMVLPLLPIYAEQFSTDELGIQIGLLMASFSAMQFLFAPLWGNLSDRIGRRPVLMVGLAASAVFYALFGVATIYSSLSGLFVTRIGAGIAGATIPTASAYIADTTTPENRTRGMALVGMAFGMGFTFGPLLGFLAVPEGADSSPSPWPGYAASLLSAVAFGCAFFLLPESNPEGNRDQKRKIFDFEALRVARNVPRVMLSLVAIFVCVFAFANMETTLSSLLKNQFEMGWRDVCISFAFIGFICAFIQGGIVRPLSRRLDETTLATLGAAAEVVGFAVVIWAVTTSSATELYAGIAIVASGYSIMQPSLNSMLSRATAENKQGTVMGLGQSFSAMARITGAALAFPLLYFRSFAPFIVGAVMMFGCGLLIARSGLRGAASESGVSP